MTKPMTVVTMEQVVEQSARVGRPNAFPTQQSLIDFCRNVHGEWLATGVDQRVLQGSDEFYLASLMGTEGGESFAPVMDGLHLLEEMFAMLGKGTRALIIGSPITVATVANVVDQVVTPSNLQTKLMEKYLDTSLIPNVEMTTYEALVDGLVEFDYAQVLLHMVACDEQLLHAIIDALPQGRVMVLQNSGNGGELYTALDESLSHHIHSEIRGRGDVLTYHLPGFVAQTICIKK
jgi:hypothetical protein